MAKMENCCRKYQVQLASAKRELVRLARLEAYHSQQGHKNDRLPVMLREQKAEISRINAAIVDHEAEHAGVPA